DEAEILKLRHVLRRQLDVVLERHDLFRRSSLCLERVGQVLPSLRIVRMLRGVLLRLRDGCPAATGAEDRLHEGCEVEPARSDAEERETDGEDDHHQSKRPLRAPTKAREEESLLYRARGDGPAASASTAAAGGASMAR